jgi:hypothetical protein
MMGRSPDRAQQRRRKQDLLLASKLARAQVIGSFDEVAGRADAVIGRIEAIRRWLSNPLLWMAGSAAGVIVLGAALRRERAVRAVTVALRWGWLGWRLWRSAAPALASRQHRRSTG